MGVTVLLKSSGLARRLAGAFRAFLARDTSAADCI